MEKYSYGIKVTFSSKCIWQALAPKIVVAFFCLDQKKNYFGMLVNNVDFPKECDSTEKSPKAVFVPHDPRMLIGQLCASHTRLCLLPARWFQSVGTPERSCSNLLLRGAVSWHAPVATPRGPASCTLPPASDQGSLRAVLLGPQSHWAGLSQD